MSEEKESERFRRLADNNLELVYEAIKTSQEPWWGFKILSNFEFFKIRDDARTKELIEFRSQYIIESIQTSSTPWDIIWTMQRYLWFFERDDVLETLAEVIKKSNAPWQVFNDLRHHRILMRNPNLRSAFIHAIQHSPGSSNVISTLRDYPDFLSEARTVKTIENAIRNSKDFLRIIVEVTQIRVLDENKMIQDAIIYRIDDIAKTIQSSDFIWQNIRALDHVDAVTEDNRIINAISSTIKKQDGVALQTTAIFCIRLMTNLTDSEIIQNTVAYVLESVDSDEICRVLNPVGDSKLLVESESVQSAIANRIDAVASNILESETPRKAVEDIGMILNIIKDEKVKEVIRTRLPDIIKDFKNAGDMDYFTWNFFERSILIPDIYRSSEVRELIGTNIILEDVYGNYTKRIASYPSLVRDPIIRKAILKAITEFEVPAWFICSLDAIPDIYEDESIRFAIKERIPKIIELIETDDASENLSLEIAENEFLMKFEDIEKSIFDRIRSTPIPWKTIAGFPDTLLELDIVKEIISKGISDLSNGFWDEINDSLDWSLMRILRSEVARNSEEIHAVLDRYLDRLLVDIESTWEIWYLASFIEEVPYYLENDRVLNAIIGRTNDLAHALKTRDDWMYILNMIASYEEIFSDETIIKSIATRIQTTHEPWCILDNDSLEFLLRDESICDALRARIPDFVFGIQSTIEVSFITKEIEKVDFLSEDQRISTAVNEYREMIE